MAIIEQGSLKAGDLSVQIENASGTIINPATGFALPPYDSITVNYTNSAKTAISSVIYKLGVSTVATITATYPSGTQEVYTQS